MWSELWELHRGKCIGVIGGLTAGLVFLMFGFWKMIVFSLLVLVGFYFGVKSDRQEPWVDLRRFMKWLREKRDLYR